MSDGHEVILVLCTFCGGIRTGREGFLIDMSQRWGGLSFTACDDCYTRVEQLGTAPHGRTTDMLQELARVLRDQPELDPVEHVLAWERANRAKKARASFRVV